jgi:DNA repair exonuclease SbcCD ATPase subunit
MRLAEIRLEGFKSFKAPQTFTFPEAPGLYFMSGVNEVQPRLGANATGKSTLLSDALTWVWFDKTTKGLRAGAVRSWGGRAQARVELDYYRTSGELVTVCRTSGPNTWKARVDGGDWFDLANDAGNPVLVDLKLSFQTWQAAAVIAQGRPMFLDLKADEKSAMFGQLLDLDTWLARSKAASDAANDVDAECRGLERELSALASRLNTLNQSTHEDEQEAWLRGVDSRLGAAAKDYERLLHKRETAAKAEEAASVAALHARRAFERAATGAEEDAEIRKLTATRAEQRQEWSASHARYLDLIDAAGRINNMSECPTCRQHLSAAAHDIAFDLFVREITAAEKLAKALDDQVNALTARIDEMGAALREIDRVRGVKRGEAEDATRKMDDARRDLAVVDQALDRLEDEVERIEAEVSPYANLARRNQSDREQAKKDLDALSARLARKQDRHYYLSYWVKGFKQIRLDEMASALRALEVEVSQALVELGLVGWDLHFSVDKVDRKGRVTKGFSVDVISPEQPGVATPWEAWSGGEAQRLREATQMGLADLIRQRTGASINLEVWDEPTAGLNSQGIVDLLDSLASRAARERRQIWVVDHNSLGYGGFTGGAMVIKTKSGSTLR